MHQQLHVREPDIKVLSSAETSGETVEEFTTGSTNYTIDNHLAAVRQAWDLPEGTSSSSIEP